MLCLAVMVLGIARLRFDVEILNLLPGRLSAVQGLKIYQEHFSAARELLVTVESNDAETSEAAARLLAQRLRSETNLVAGVTWQPAWRESPSAAAELAAYLWLNQPPELVRDLEHRLEISRLGALLDESREVLATSLSPSEVGLRAYDPLGLLQLPESVTRPAGASQGVEEPFASSDGLFRVLFVESAVDLASYKACRAWLDDIRRVIAQERSTGNSWDGVEIHVSGRPVFVSEIAGGMESDLTGSSAGTLAVIAALFWLSHRRVRPLLWLLFLLVATLAGTLALGGLFLGSINVVSLGFAAMLLGLAEDYGIVIYQEFRSHPALSVAQLRRTVAPGILWSAVTSAGAFSLLNLSVLPGLRQLGTMVALGILLGAVVMLYVYLPWLPRLRHRADSSGDEGRSAERFLLFPARRTLPRSAALLATGLALVISLVMLIGGGIQFDHSANVLKPKRSEATATLERIQQRFGRQQEPIWLLVSGKDVGEVARRLAAVDEDLKSCVARGEIASFTAPGAMWANPGNQADNRVALAALIERRQAFRAAGEAAGFRPEAFALSEAVLDTWGHALGESQVFWPSEPANRWLLGKFAALAGGSNVALVLIQPVADSGRAEAFLADWAKREDGEGVLLTGWPLLGANVFDAVAGDLPVVLIPIAVLVLVSLALAYRGVVDVVWSLVALTFSGVCLTGAMSFLGWRWNLLNLMALPLLLGMGVDFSIHILLALRRQQGDVLAVHRSVGRALMLAGSTTVAGFASLSFSSNAGMASLGQVCALGITLALLTSVYLLPAWWTSIPSGGRGRQAGRTCHGS